MSVFAITDGESYITLPSVQDHKAIRRDRGPNTGGMGAYSPAPVLTEELAKIVEQNVFKPLISGLRKEGISYRGVIFGGLIITADGPKVLEFNVRFGDPEAQVLFPRLRSDLCPLLYEAARGNLSAAPAPRWLDDAAVCVIMASRGYPGNAKRKRSWG